MSSSTAARDGQADERRTTPRLGLDTPVTVFAEGGRSPARTINASERGLLLLVADDTWIAPGQQLTVRIGGGEELLEVPGRVVRSEPAERLVAVHFTGPARRPPRGPRGRVRRSRAAPPKPRERVQVRAELRSLSTLIYEQALMGADDPPVETLLVWADRLAGELGVAGVGRPADNRGLLHAMVRLSRDADELAPRPAAAVATAPG